MILCSYAFPYRYLSYDEMVVDINSLPLQFPGCVNVYEAIDKWPSLATENVRQYFRLFVQILVG